MKTSPFINKTKHSTKEGNRKIQDERTQVVLTNKESYEREGEPLGEHEQIKYPNKESYKESESLREHEQIKLPKQRILQKGVGTLREHEQIKYPSLPKVMRSISSDREREREREHFIFILLWLDANEESE